MARLVALAAEGGRSKIRAVGLDKDAIRWRPGGNFRKRGVARKCYWTGEREIKAQIERILGHLTITDEAVKDASGCEIFPVLAQDGNEIGVRVAIMQDHRQMDLAGQCQLPSERVSLNFSR